MTNSPRTAQKQRKTQNCQRVSETQHQFDESLVLLMGIISNRVKNWKLH